MRGRPRNGTTVACKHCGADTYCLPSRQRIYCGAACYHAAKIAKKKTACANCITGQRVPGQSYCKPCGLTINAAWRQANRPPSVGVARANVHVYKTPEQKRLEKNACARRYRKANPTKVAMWNRLRQLRQRAAGPAPDWTDISWMVCSQDARCTYCGVLFEAGYEIDHKTPISRGGDNALENLHLVCATCNMRKGAKTHEEYLEKLG